MRNMGLENMYLYIDLVERHDFDDRITTADPFSDLGSPSRDVTGKAGDDRVLADAVLELIDDGLLNGQPRGGLDQFLLAGPGDGQLVPRPGIVVITFGSDRRRNDRREIIFGHGPLLGQGGETCPPGHVKFPPGSGRQHPGMRLIDFPGAGPVLQFSERLLA